MKKNLTYILFFSVGVMISFLYIFLNRVNISESEKIISLNDTRGIDLYLNNKPYTLNFKQQVNFIHGLCQLNKINESSEIIPTEFNEKILIHRFNDLSSIEMILIGSLDNQLIYKINESNDDNDNGYHVGGYHNYIFEKLCLNI